jgi:chemotaxis protein CheC
MLPPEAGLIALERDALTELVNIGVSRAASRLCKIVGEQVLLSSPAVEVLPQATTAQIIDQQRAERLVGIRLCPAGPCRNQ